MISFTSDYTEGAHPEILKRLQDTNFCQEPGYGEDSFSEDARRLVREALGRPEAGVFFLVGGTQTNSTVIDAVIPHYGAVIAAETGHIAVHESGAVELSGHKVITLPSHEGKMAAKDLQDYLKTFYEDGAWPHMAHPDMVYISFPTEYGTIYSKAELEAIRKVCKEYKLKLFIDGARLGYGLESHSADVTLKDIASLCDVFYIGGTKVGALCGEAVVFPAGDAPEHFFTCARKIIYNLQRNKVAVFKLSYNVDRSFYGRLLQTCNGGNKRVSTVCKRQVVLRVLWGKQAIRQCKISRIECSDKCFCFFNVRHFCIPPKKSFPAISQSHLYSIALQVTCQEFYYRFYHFSY